MEKFDWVLTSDNDEDIEIKGDMTIGREEDSDICIPDVKVSRKHAVISLTPSGIILKDLGSANGTLVNGMKITDSLILNPKDVINFHAKSFNLDKLPAVQDPGVVIRSEQFGEFELSGEQVIGRDPSCDIHIADDIISRRHARIKVTRNGIIIDDFGSVNGTYVNGKRIKKPTKLQAGDHLRFCDKAFQIAKKFDPDATRIATPADDPDATQVIAGNTLSGKVNTPPVMNQAAVQSGHIKVQAPSENRKTEVFEASNPASPKRPSAIQRQQHLKDNVGESLIHRLEEGIWLEFKSRTGQGKVYCLKHIDWKEGIYTFATKMRLGISKGGRFTSVRKSREQVIKDLSSGNMIILGDKQPPGRFRSLIQRKDMA